MSKKQMLLSAIILIGLCFICKFIYDNFKVPEEVMKTEIIIDQDKDCNNGLSLYYTDSRKRDYYLYCLDEIIVDFKDHSLPLNRAIDTKQITMDSFLNEYLNISFKEEYKDGGSIHYYGDNISVIQCNTIDGNNNYYFGPKSMKYEEGFCKEESYVCSFTKTYQVLDISDINDSYSYLTLKQYNNEEVASVKVKKELITDIVEENYYEFRFGSIGKGEENIKAIFEEQYLLSINETNKIDLEQINENICK